MTDKAYYSVLQDNDRIIVQDANHANVIECSDIVNAKHYCVLLNQAFKLGFKTGYKSASESLSK